MVMMGWKPQKRETPEEVDRRMRATLAMMQAQGMTPKGVPPRG